MSTDAAPDAATAAAATTDTTADADAAKLRVFFATVSQ
jgi:hypothetical protein